MYEFVIKNNPKGSLELLAESIQLFNELDDKKWVANTHSAIGIIQNTIGNKEIALYNALRALDYYESNPDDSHDRVMVYYVLGTIYKDLKKYSEALSNLKKITQISSS